MADQTALPIHDDGSVTIGNDDGAGRLVDPDAEDCCCGAPCSCEGLSDTYTLSFHCSVRRAPDPDPGCDDPLLECDEDVVITLTDFSENCGGGLWLKNAVDCATQAVAFGARMLCPDGGAWKLGLSFICGDIDADAVALIGGGASPVGNYPDISVACKDIAGCPSDPDTFVVFSGITIS